MIKRFTVIIFLFASFTMVKAADLPGGMLRTAENLPANTYELLVSPSYLISAEGAYLSSEIRYQSFESFGVGLGFGAGEVGFNFGVNGVWHVLSHLELQPEIALVGGVYFNRVSEANFFLMKLAPMVSQTFYTTWAEFTPYGAMQFTPSFRLGEPANLFSIKGALGVQVTLHNLDGLRLMTEASLGLLNSTYEISFGISYPFVAM